jgi:hypothetical protein
MTIAEFKAWLCGFSEGMGAPPTQEQWEKIKEKLAQVRESYPVVPAIPNLPQSPTVAPPEWQKWPYVTCGGATTASNPSAQALN